MKLISFTQRKYCTFTRKRSTVAEQPLICYTGRIIDFPCYFPPSELDFMNIPPQRNKSHLSHETFLRQRNYRQLLTTHSSTAELLHVRQKAFPRSGTALYLLLHNHSSAAEYFSTATQNILRQRNNSQLFHKPFLRSGTITYSSESVPP